jgi:hypothetical protein
VLTGPGASAQLFVKYYFRCCSEKYSIAVVKSMIT